jgi:hypothetical protein
MTTDSKRADQLLDLALRHARTIRVVIGELAKLNAERELRIITRQLADLTRRGRASTATARGTHRDHAAAHAFRRTRCLRRRRGVRRRHHCRMEDRSMTTDHAIDHRARRAAKRVGLIARKKHGGFQLIEPLQRRGGRGAL